MDNILSFERENVSKRSSLLNKLWILEKVKIAAEVVAAVLVGIK